MGLPFLLQLTTRLLFSGLQRVPLVRQIDQPLLEFCLPATMRAGRAPLTFALLMGAEARGFRDAEDFQTGSKIHQLTESSLTSLKGSCAASNSTGFDANSNANADTQSADLALFLRTGRVPAVPTTVPPLA